MKPIKTGQIVKFHTPLEDENPDQQYVIVELHDEGEIHRAHIKALNTGLPFPGINVVKLDDLEVIEVGTEDLIGHVVHIKKIDSSKVLGRIIAVSSKNIDLNLLANAEGVDTNVFVTIVDKDGEEHSGTLFVN